MSESFRADKADVFLAIFSSIHGATLFSWISNFYQCLKATFQITNTVTYLKNEKS